MSNLLLALAVLLSVPNGVTAPEWGGPECRHVTAGQTLVFPDDCVRTRCKDDPVGVDWFACQVRIVTPPPFSKILWKARLIFQWGGILYEDRVLLGGGSDLKGEHVDAANSLGSCAGAIEIVAAEWPGCGDE